MGLIVGGVAMIESGGRCLAANSIWSPVIGLDLSETNYQPSFGRFSSTADAMPVAPSWLEVVVVGVCGVGATAEKGLRAPTSAAIFGTLG
jgi:hypothetical protein